MVRWRYALVLAILLLMPTRTTADEDDEDVSNSKGLGGRRGDDAADEEEDDDDDEEEEESPQQPEKPEQTMPGRRMPGAFVGPATQKAVALTRTPKKRPLECYVCAFKSETPLRACLDPTKFRVHTITCHSVEDKCFTSVISKGSTYEAVVRGCRSSCVGSPETTCCELNRCNNQAFAMPLIQPRGLSGTGGSSSTSKANKTLPHNVLFFVTVLLVLQTVVKVPFV